MTATNNVAPNATPTPLGSINSNPQLDLSEGYPSGGGVTGAKVCYVPENFFRRND
jgi:hypothetical protein